MGSGAKSDLWCLIKADILNKKVIQLKNPEVSSLGLATLSAIAFGKFKDIKTAVRESVEIKNFSTLMAETLKYILGIIISTVLYKTA